MNKGISRRKFISSTFLHSSVLIGAGGLSVMLAGACSRGKKDGAGDENSKTGNSKAGNEKPAGAGENAAAPCEDMSGVSEGELQKRKAFGYVKESPIPDKQCQNCNLWLPPGGDQKCGGCTLFKGPVAAEAYCTYWAPQV